MEGVIVQTERVVRGTPIVITVLLIGVLALFLSVYLIKLIPFCKKNKSKAVKSVVLYSVAAALCVAMSFLLVKGSTTIHNNLIVTIDDHVRFNEFYEHYEVVSRDGKLYTVRELPIEEVEAGDSE